MPNGPVRTVLDRRAERRNGGERSLDLLHLLFGGVGGQVEVVRALAVETSRRGLASGAILIGPPGTQLERADDWKELDAVWIVDKHHRMDRSAARCIRQLLAEVGPRALVWHSPYAPLQVARARRSGDVEAVLHVEHQPLNLRDAGDDARSLGAILVADAMVVLVDDYVRRHPFCRLISWRGRPQRVIGNGVDTALFAPQPRAQGDDDGHAVSSRPGIAVGMAGRIVPSKDFAGLIEGFERFHAARPMGGDRLVIMGEGEDRPRLEELVRRRGLADVIEFTGLLGRSELATRLRGLDVYVQSSFGETQSIAVLQAQATGLAVVGSDVPGVRDAIDDGRTGILVEGGDPAALADALQRLADDVGLRALLGEHARDQVEAEHSARRMADGYLRLLGELDPEGPWSSVDAARTE